MKKILKVVLIVSMVLIVTFIGIYFYVNSKKGNVDELPKLTVTSNETTKDTFIYRYSYNLIFYYTRKYDKNAYTFSGKPSAQIKLDFEKAPAEYGVRIDGENADYDATNNIITLPEKIGTYTFIVQAYDYSENGGKIDYEFTVNVE